MNGAPQASGSRPNVAPEGPPPTSHTLRPHHVHILKIFVVLFHTYADKSLPSQFLLHMYRVLLPEVSEVMQPATYAQLMAAIEDGAKPSTALAFQVVSDIKETHAAIRTPDQLVLFFQNVPFLFLERDEDEPAPLTRRSLFGYFARRCFVSFLKLSFEAVQSLWQDYHLWVNGNLREGNRAVRKGIISNSYNLFKTQADKKEYAQADAYALWEKGLAVGDEMVATENLRRFFEQHFHELNDSGVRQHALLNLARMHYLRHQYLACRKLLQEAITTSRTNNDPQTLQHCIGLLNRLPPTERGRRPFMNDLQAELHPMEILHDVKKLLTVSHQQPISASFEKIAQASSMYDYWTDNRRDAVTEAEQWGQHAVQSIAWTMLGNAQLAAIEENVVAAFTEAGGPDNTRLTMILNRAYRYARQGKCQEAISMLLDPSVFSGLTIVDYQLWANEIWNILVLRASRRGQERMYRDYLAPKRPSGVFGPREYWFGAATPLGSRMRDPLYEVLSLREVKQAHTAVEPLLTALWHAEFLQRYALYRPALVLLADVSLEYGMTKWSRRIVDEIMPQIINGDDLELRAFACFTLARCMIAAGEQKLDALQECLPYLKMAEKDYTNLDMLSALQDVQFLQSVILHNLGMTKERDETATRQQKTELLRSEIEAEVVEDWITEVWDLVADIGCKLAVR